MIKVKFGEQSPVHYNTGLIQKSQLNSGQTGLAVFLDSDPVVLDSAWSPSVKRYVDVESQEFFNKHKEDLQNPKTRYYFLVARFDIDANKQVIASSFRLEYLDLGGGTYKDFCDATVAQPNYNCAYLTKVEKTLNGKNISYIKPYPSFIQLPADADARVSPIKNDKNEVTNLWKEFQKCVGVISGAQYEQLCNAGTTSVQAPQQAPVNATFQSPVQGQAAPKNATAPQPAAAPQAAPQTAMFGNDPFVGGSDGVPF